MLDDRAGTTMLIGMGVATAGFAIGWLAFGVSLLRRSGRTAPAVAVVVTSIVSLVPMVPGPRQIGQPRPDVVEGRTQLSLEQLARDAIDRRCRDRPSVHVEPHTRTLGEHRGLPQLSDRPSRRPLHGVTHESL
jgi:hypothetical protein